MDTLFGMQIFQRVVQTGSFSAAGRQVGLSPASVFRHMNALEDRLGARLMNRTSRKLSLTEAGGLYYKRLERILADIRDADAQVGELQMAPRGTLRVHCRVSLGAQYLAPALPDLLTRYPDLRVDLRLADRNVDLVEENIDVAVLVGRLRDSSLIQRKLASSPRILCASPSYLAVHPAPVQPGDLAAHNCLAYRTGAPRPVWRFLRDRRVLELPVGGSLLADNAEVVRLAAVAGLGVALLPNWSIGPDLAAGRLRRILPDYEATPLGFDNGIYAVMQRSRHRSVKVALFIEFLVRLFGDRNRLPAS